MLVENTFKVDVGNVRIEGSGHPNDFRVWIDDNEVKHLRKVELRLEIDTAPIIEITRLVERKDAAAP